MPRIIARSEWGFNGWRTTPRRRSLNNWTHFVVHYEGENPCGHQTGASVPRGIHAFHKNGRGWAGIGYNFVVDQAGNIFEGRGFDHQGAHKPSGPGANPHGLGVQVHIGGDERPTAAALDAVAWLYAHASRKVGRALVKSWHGQGYATSCPGGPLRTWVSAGMPRPSAPTAPAPAARPAPAKRPVPAWPLGCNHLLGLRGPNVHNGAGGDKAGHAAIKTWQAQMRARGWRIGVDGLWGRESASVARAFQKEKRITTDPPGAVGPRTWVAAWAEPVT